MPGACPPGPPWSSLVAGNLGRADEMMTMGQSLADLVRASRITRETALAHCFRTEDFERYLG